VTDESRAERHINPSSGAGRCHRSRGVMSNRSCTRWPKERPPSGERLERSAV
jgi:hypothetical protein